MQTIIIVLNPGKLVNPVTDLCYSVADHIEKSTNGMIQDNGYDYINCEEGTPGPLMAIWLKTEKARENWPLITRIFQVVKFSGNDLSLSAKIYISENDTEEIENSTLVFPQINL